MKTFLIIALLTSPHTVVATYPMPDLSTCETVRDHKAVRESWPGKLLYCMETKQ